MLETAITLIMGLRSDTALANGFRVGDARRKESDDSLSDISPIQPRGWDLISIAEE